MSYAALFEHLARAGSADCGIVVTPNRRLARMLGREFDAWQAARGRRVWETPRILPFGAFGASLHDVAQHDAALTGVRAALTGARRKPLVDDARSAKYASPRLA